MKKTNRSIKLNSGETVELLEIQKYYVHRFYRCGGGADRIDLEGSFNKDGVNEVSLWCNLEELEDLVDEETFNKVVELEEYDSLDFEEPYAIEGLTITIYQVPLDADNLYSIYDIESE